MTDPTAPTPGVPIQVNAKAGPDQWAAGARQLILVLGPLAAFAAANHMLRLEGWLNLAIAIIGPAAALAAIVLGQVKTRRDSLAKTVMAQALPDSIAHVKTKDDPAP